MQAAVCDAVCSETVCAAIGAPHAKALQLRLVNLAAAAEVSSKSLVAEQSEAEAERIAAQQADRRLIQVQCPSPREDRQSPVREKTLQHTPPPPLSHSCYS